MFEIVIDAPGNSLILERIAETMEYLSELVSRKQVEEHQDVGLLGQFVAVRSISFRFKNTVEALDVAVPFSVPFPVKFLQAVVALKLADDSVTVEDNSHFVADVFPSLQFLRPQTKVIPQGFTPVRRHKLDRVQGAT